MSNPTALVTGASGRIGRAIARVLAAGGHFVAVHYGRNRAGAEELCNELNQGPGRAFPVQADLSTTAGIDGLFTELRREFSQLDLLVNNAGVTRYRPFLEVDESFWNEVTDTDWKGPFFTAQQAARWMVEGDKGGCIVNITSTQQSGCWPNASVYGSSKAALAKFTRHIAMELAPHRIRVNAVAPGYTMEPGDYSWKMRAEVEKRIPSGRFVRPDEIAHAVAYLASPQADSVTGSCLIIDGGANLPVVTENSYC